MADIPHNYDILLKCSDPKFVNPQLHTTGNAKNLTIEYLRVHGFQYPILLDDCPENLGMTVPKDFTVNSVVQFIGENEPVEVIDVKQQTTKEMTLRNFVNYYNDPERYKQGLYNVLSMEFSFTKLATLVQCPAIVKEIGWVERYWPLELRARQERNAKLGNPNFHCYPKVQYYCLMSVKTCYTDFHIDFGGTSVWYHIYKGVLYDKWMKQENNNFFGDLVEKCARVELKAGETFMIPSGWIHSVYTPEDSLVFGGNFMHSFSIEMQFNIHRAESKNKVETKYRFPFFEETLWYVANGIVSEATGISYVRHIGVDSTAEASVDKSDNQAKAIIAYNDAYLSKLSGKEKNGLRNLAETLRKDLRKRKSHVGEGIEQPECVLANLLKCLDRSDSLQSDQAKVVLQASNEGSAECKPTVDNMERKFCICRQEKEDNMLQCDGSNCPYDWYHFKCVGIVAVPPDGAKWFCPNCNVE